MRKLIIWCEVTCNTCGRIANHSGWYSRERIKKLKLETKHWKDDDLLGTLCPECYAKEFNKGT